MKQKIENRIKYLKDLKAEIILFAKHSKDEIELSGLSERNMHIGMEISFLEELLAD